MMRLIHIDMFGQLKIGDSMLIVDQEKIIKCKVKEVLNYGTDKEEIVFNKRANKYFIVSMYLKNKSWAKQVFKIEQGEKE